MKEKSSILNINANIIVLVAYLGGLILKWNELGCYFAWIIPLLIYLFESKSELVKKQSAQATLLFFINSIISLAILILLFFFVPNKDIDIYKMIITGSLLIVGLLSIVSMIISIAIIYFSISAILKAYKYKDYNIPFLSNYITNFRKYLDRIKDFFTKNPYKEENDIKEEFIKPKRHKIRIHNLKEI